MEQISPLMVGGGPVEELCLAGPGEALVSPTTRIALRILGWHYPGVMRSLWTNGLLLADQIDELVRLGLSKVIITINAFTRETSGRLYERLTYRGRGYRGGDAGVLLSEKQWLGLSLAKDRGMRVVVHTSLIPRVNEQDLAQIARQAGILGADGMALTSLAASGKIGRQGDVIKTQIKEKRIELGVYLPQIDLLL
jgi:nitrogen fixation protein NifB